MAGCRRARIHDLNLRFYGLCAVQPEKRSLLPLCHPQTIVLQPPLHSAFIGGADSPHPRDQTASHPSISYLRSLRNVRLISILNPIGLQSPLWLRAGGPGVLALPSKAGELLLVH